jgi:hypothetical protein
MEDITYNNTTTSDVLRDNDLFLNPTSSDASSNGTHHNNSSSIEELRSGSAAGSAHSSLQRLLERSLPSS